MQLLSKEQVKAVADRKYKEVPVPEWGDDVGVRICSLTVAEHRVLTGMMGEKEEDNAVFSANLMVAGCIDENGKALFVPDDVKWLIEKSAAAVKRVGNEISQLSGLGKNAVEEAKKNS